MSYETNQAAYLNLLSQADAIVANVTIRLNTFNDVATANERAWESARQEALAAGAEYDEAIEIADEAVPGMTEEQVDAYLTGDPVPGEVVGADDAFDDSLAEFGIPGLADILEETGARVLDADEDQRAQYDEMTEELMYPDLESYPNLVVVLPAGFSQTDRTRILETVWEVAPDSETEAEEKLRKEKAAYNADPLVGIPFENRDYVAQRWRSQEILFDDDYGDNEWLAYQRRGRVDDYVSAEVAPIYSRSDILDLVSTMSAVDVFRFQQLSADIGYYGESRRPMIPGVIDTNDLETIGNTMFAENNSGINFWDILEKQAESGRFSSKLSEQGKAPATGTKRQPFSVPAHLRSIPGEKTVAEETKARFREKMGRDARPDELIDIANELTGYYEKSNQEEIALYLAAYNGDNQGLLTGAQMQRIEDPGAATSFDIADTYANEIDLNKRRESNSDSFQRMLSAVMGGRASIAGATAASGVQQVGRQ